MSSIDFQYAKLNQYSCTCISFQFQMAEIDQVAISGVYFNSL